jgi:outer membrane protein
MSRLMIRFLFATILMSVFVITQADAQTSTAPASSSIAPAKIAWVDLDKVITECAEGVILFKNIQKFIDDKQDEIRKLKKELDDLGIKLSVGADKLKEEYRDELEEQIEAKEIQFQRLQQDAQKEFKSKNDKAGNTILKKLLPVIEKIGKEKGLNAIQFRNANRDAWIDPALIITEEVIKVYDQTYGAGTSKAPAKKP